MAREILFRGKRTDSGEWVTGTPFIFADRCKMIQAVAVHPDFVDEGNVYYSEGFPVDPETVGQFTGLSDKNGKRIFEGDIITFPWDEERPTELFEIVFNEGQYLAQPLAHDGKVWAITLNGYTHDMEVVGNIHDNPELLYGEES